MIRAAKTVYVARLIESRNKNRFYVARLDDLCINYFVMPKIINEDHLEMLISAVASFSEGATARQVFGLIEKPVSLRTLQSQLSKLVKHARLERHGKGKATRYYISTEKGISSIAVNDAEKAIKGIALSDIALVIKEKVTLPLFERKPVGYNRSFLDEYCPNEIFYLSSQIRQRLHSLGSVSGTTLPAGTYIREVFNRLLIDLSWNSSRLEGNTYSLLETEILFEIGKNAEGKDSKEAQMILNHKGAIELLSNMSDEICLDTYTVCNIHALLSDNLLSDPQACGRLRSRSVGISGTVFQPLEVPQMIEECFNIILDKASAIRDPFEQAFFVMVQLPYLQPFEDVNKRVSRLVANIPLVKMNLCPLSFVDVPVNDFTRGILGIYELNSVEYLRDVFVWAYQRSCERYSAVRQSLGEPDPLRLRYQTLLKNTIHDIIHQCMTKEQAMGFIKNSVANVNDNENAKRLTEIIETEISSIHEGSILRYNLRRAEYQAWKTVW